MKLALLILASCGIAAAQYNYGEVLGKSLLFYEAQRTGRLPSSNRIPWRADSMMQDGQDVGLDLTGGYFDAGDYVKFGFPMSSFTTVLGWGLLDYKNGYQRAGEYENGLAALKWATDYFIKAHPSANEFYGHVGDAYADHAYWGRPEDWVGSRPAYKITTSKPGSDLAGETAAALAVASMVFKDVDAGYSATCLNHAKELYNFAKNFRGIYSDSIPQAAEFYRSWSGYGDELGWSAAWLYRATNDQQFLNEARGFYNEFGLGNRASEFSWDSKEAGVQVLLAKITGETQFKNDAKNFCDWVVYSAPKTPKGLVYLQQWGSMRHAGNVAFICMQAGDAGINTDAYYNFARSQINYMLGSTGRSFVVGYGNNPPQRPHHASSSCPNRPASCDWNDFSQPGPNPQVLTGALVGGPDQNDFYEDKRDDYVKNEVTTDYNAGFTSALAGLQAASLRNRI